MPTFDYRCFPNPKGKREVNEVTAVYKKRVVVNCNWN